jgi:hypothetical protein
VSDTAQTGSASQTGGNVSSGSFDHGSGSSAATQTDSGRPAPGSAASIRPIPGAPPRSWQQQQEPTPNGDSNVAANGEAPETNPEAKKESRYDRTKREKAEWRAQIEAFQREREAFFKEKADFEESKKPKRNYSLADLKRYREEWAQEGKDDLVAQADQAIAQMENEERQKQADSRTVMELPKYGTEEHKKIWESSEADIRSRDPEFGVKGSRIDTKLREIFDGPNAQMYRDHPYGIYAAYAEAEREILKEDNTKLKAELQRVTGLTSIGGGVPGRIADDGNLSTKEFAKLSSAEMRKRLIAGRNRPDNSLPWL